MAQRIVTLLTQEGDAATAHVVHHELELHRRHLGEVRRLGFFHRVAGGLQPASGLLAGLDHAAVDARALPAGEQSHPRGLGGVGLLERRGHPESRGIGAVESGALRPCDIELLLLTRPDLPLTPAVPPTLSIA